MRRFYGLQYHSEVTHSPEKMETLRQFLFNVCGVTSGWIMTDVMEEEIKVIKEMVGTKDHVICALSVCVDSTIAATLIHKAIRDSLHCVFVDNAYRGCVSAFFFDLPSYNLVRVIGIDLGTTYSRVGVYEFNGRVEIIANDQGNLNTPSWVAFTDHGQILIGEAAKDQAALNQDRTVFDVKKLLGRNFDDEQVQRVMKQVPYNIVNKDGKPYIQVKMIKDNNEMTKVFFSPEEISAMILVKMKETAEAYFGRKMKNAVLSVPAYFNETQRQATKDAAVIAGLNVLEIINEPAAAALAYGLDKKGVVKKNIMIFDLGGGTFDVTILAIHDGVFQVLAATGDTHLGGVVFDLRIMEYFIKVIKKKHGKDISKDNRALDKLRRESERAKRALSTKHHVRLEIESFLDGTNFSQVLTRVRFEELNNDLFRKTMGPVNKAMDEARLQKSQIDEIVLVGGSSRIPKVQQLLKEYFQGKEPNKKGVNPDEAVAYGAAIQGGILSEEEEREENSRFLWPLSQEELLSQEEIEQMVSEAEEFASEHERINARRSLETYIYDMKNQINDKDKLAEKLESREKEKIEGAMKEASEWLVDNQSSEKDHYEEKHKKVEAVCKPIITAVYQKRPLSTIPSSHALMHML